MLLVAEVKPRSPKAKDLLLKSTQSVFTRHTFASKLLEAIFFFCPLVKSVKGYLNERGFGVMRRHIKWPFAGVVVRINSNLIEPQKNLELIAKMYCRD